MKHTLSLLAVMQLTPLAAIHADEVCESLSPHKRAILEAKSSPPVEATFSFDAPAGPQFTDAEKEAQRAPAFDARP